MSSALNGPGFGTQNPGPPGIHDAVKALQLHDAQFWVTPQVIKIPNPGAGAAATVRVPPGVIWRIMTIKTVLTTSAVVANRRVLLIASDGTNEYARIGSTADVAAGLTVHVTFAGGSTVNDTTSSAIVSPLPSPNIPMVAGHSLVITVSNFDVGDTLTGISVYTIEVRRRNPNEMRQYLDGLDSGDVIDPYPGLRIGV